MTSEVSPDRPLEAEDVLAGPVVDVAGVAIRLDASDPERAEAVASLFRHAAPSMSPPRCSLFFGDRVVDIPTSQSPAEVAGTQIWRLESGQLRVRSPEGLTARSSSDAIVVGGEATSLARVFRYVCLVSLTHALAQHGRHLLHAGAIVSDGRAILVLGETGTGKSTLTFAAHRLGWPVLADDAVALHREDGHVMAQGLPRPISVPEDVVAEPIPGGRLVPEDPRARTELPGGTLDRSTNPVAGVVVTTRGEHGQPSLELRAGPDTLRTVLEASASLADPDLRPEVFAIAGALARQPAWSLRHGSNPAEALADAARALRALERLLHEHGGGVPRTDGPAPAPS